MHEVIRVSRRHTEERIFANICIGWSSAGVVVVVNTGVAGYQLFKGVVLADILLENKYQSFNADIFTSLRAAGSGGVL